MYRSQKLALRYLTAALLLFGVMTAAGLLSALYYVEPSTLYNVLDFSVAKTLHIDTLVIWLLMGFIGSVYWFLPQELEHEVEGIWLAEILFFVFFAAVLAVAGIFIFVQYGTTSESSLWLINQGRKYVEAPRWAAIGIVLVVLVFVYNVTMTAIRARRMTGILWVLALDLIPLTALYLNAFSAPTNMSEDQYWWWWLVHMWVEGTWEVLIGCIMAWALMDIFGTSRKIVEAWLYIEVMLVLGTGILGLGHHYFWIGTPDYWLTIGGVFSAMEPLPLLGMVVHAVYDAGTHKMKTTNRPAMFWLLAEAFGNFIGAGMFGFMMTLPQINLYSHGTQWTVSHGHFAFWGAYACGVIAIFYIALQKVREAEVLESRAWKWSMAMLNIGMIGMVGGLLIAGITQAFYERAQGGSTLQAFVVAAENIWFRNAMVFRLAFGIVFALGYLALVYDMLTIGKKSTVPAGAELKPA
ncbi:MAG: cbb3-type cytochrome c oxidase subunit I [Gammaproteobacteria bacterium]